MEDFKGTPGPWSVDAVNYHDYGIVSDTNGEEVTTLPAERSEHDFNAMLIAAAPELLEALQGYMSAVERMNQTMKDGLNVQGAISALVGHEDMAHAAIAKALGK